MKLVLQRVSRASVSVGGEVKGAIGSGLMVLVGVDIDDAEEDARKLAAKTVACRIFNDANGVMNLSVKDVEGEVLAVSQFTLGYSVNGYEKRDCKSMRSGKKRQEWY